MSFWQLVTEKINHGEAVRRNEYRELVRAIGDGDEPSEERVVRVLADAGKTVEACQADVAIYQARIGQRQLLDSLPKLQAEKKQLEATIASEREKFDAARKEYDKAAWPRSQRLTELHASITEADRVRLELQKTCPDAELVKLHADTARKIGKLRDVANRLDSSAKENRGKANGRRSDANCLSRSTPSNILPSGETEERVKLARNEADQHDAAAAASEKELVPLRQQLAELEKQLERIGADMLEP